MSDEKLEKALAVVSTETVGGSYCGPGVYEHYKSGRYVVRGLAMHESELYALVIYQPASPGSALTGSDITSWARPLADFNAMVTTQSIDVPLVGSDAQVGWKPGQGPGCESPRFRYIGPLSGPK